MKLLSLFTLFLVLCACDSKISNSTYKSDSHPLLLETTYDLSTTSIAISLKNQTARNLDIATDPAEFHGTIYVESQNRQIYRFRDINFTRALETSIWDVPIEALGTGEVITWKIPISQLQTTNGDALTLDILKRAKVYSELEEVAIVPPNGNFRSDSARMFSKATDIFMPDIPTSTAQQDAAANP